MGGEQGCFGNRVGWVLHCCCLLLSISCVGLFWDPQSMGCSPPVHGTTPLSMGFPRQKYGSGLPFPSPTKFWWCHFINVASVFLAELDVLNCQHHNSYRFQVSYINFLHITDYRGNFSRQWTRTNEFITWTCLALFQGEYFNASSQNIWIVPLHEKQESPK